MKYRRALGARGGEWLIVCNKSWRLVEGKVTLRYTAGSSRSPRVYDCEGLEVEVLNDGWADAWEDRFFRRVK